MLMPNRKVFNKLIIFSSILLFSLASKLDLAYAESRIDTGEKQITNLLTAILSDNGRIESSHPLFSDLDFVCLVGASGGDLIPSFDELDICNAPQAEQIFGKKANSDECVFFQVDSTVIGPTRILGDYDFACRKVSDGFLIELAPQSEYFLQTIIFSSER